MDIHVHTRACAARKELIIDKILYARARVCVHVTREEKKLCLQFSRVRAAVERRGSSSLCTAAAHPACDSLCKKESALAYRIR